MKFKVVKLAFRAPLHLGEREEIMGRATCRLSSDTLFSAICSAISLCFGRRQLEKMLARFENGDPPFLLSSAFPYWKNNLFLPRPLKWEFSWGAGNEQDEKRKKKIAFLPLQCWELEADELNRHLKEAKLIQEGKILAFKTTPAPPDTLWHEFEVPRVSLDRLNSNSNIFHFKTVFFEKDSGLFFLIYYFDSGWRKYLETAFRLLGDEGIGGDRSAGYGLFTPHFGLEAAIPSPGEGEMSMLISLYFPRREELGFLKNCSYQIRSRAGFIYSPHGTRWRKKKVHVFSEGSIFSGLLSGAGALVDITPPGFSFHRAFRYGMALTISLPGCASGRGKHEI